MAMDTARPPEILKLHSEMVQKLGDLFSLKGRKWHKILNQVEMTGLLPAADVDDIKTMGDLFIRLMKKKGSEITYGEYTNIREILGTHNVDAEEIIDAYTTRMHEFYKDVPEFEPTEKCYTTKVGHPVIMKCSITKSKTAITNVQWKRKAKDSEIFTDIGIDNDLYTGGSLESPSLGITKTREEDNGAIYVCHATNAAGRGRSEEIQLIIQPEQEAVLKMLENIRRHVETKAEPFVKAFGRIKGSRLTFDLELDVRESSVEFAANNDFEDVRLLPGLLRHQIAYECDFNDRAINLRIVKGSIIVSFDITGATNPLHPSALALAERFTKGLKDSSIVLRDETGNPLEIQHDSIKITMTQALEVPANMKKPLVSIDQAAYCIETGDAAILTCRLLTSTPISSVTWFRVNEDGTEHPIAIDNKKYFGGSAESPSLAIDYITTEDEGRYVCYAESKFGVGKSFSTSICIFGGGTLVEKTLSQKHIADQGQGEATCGHHKGETLDLFCEVCQEIMCVECVITLHNGHSIVPLSELFQRNEHKIKTFINETEQKELFKIEQEIISIQVSLDKNLSHFESVAKEVENQRKRLKEEIDIVISETLHKLNHIKDENTKLLTSYKSELESKLRALKGQIYQCKAALQTGSDVKMSDVIRGLRTDTTLPSRPVLGTPEISPIKTLAESLTLALDKITMVCYEQYPDPSAKLESAVISKFHALNTNSRVCPASDDGVWAIENENLKILKQYSRDGDVIRSMNSPVPLTDICFSPTTPNVLACSTTDDSVMELGPEGLVHKFNTLDKPMCLCATHDGHVIVGTTNKITKYTRDGTVTNESSESSPMKITECLATENVASINSGWLYFRGDITVRNKHLTVLWRYKVWQEDILRRQEMFNPWDITCYGRGHLVVADYKKDCLQQLSGDGRNQGKLHTDITCPQSVCVDSKGVLRVVSDESNIQRLKITKAKD